MCECELFFFISDILNNTETLSKLNTEWDTLAPIMLMYKDVADDPKLVSRKIRDFYFGDKEINEDTRLELAQIWTDIFFIAYAQGEAKTLCKQLPVYFYAFKHAPKTSIWEFFDYRLDTFFKKDGKPATFSYHMDELQYLFPIKNEEEFANMDMEITKEDDDFPLSQGMVKLWTSFAETG